MDFLNVKYDNEEYTRVIYFMKGSTEWEGVHFTKK